MKYIRLYTLLLLLLLSSCSHYTAPSPLDGRWQVVDVQGASLSDYPFTSEQTVYWDFLNVLYKVGFHSRSHTFLTTYEWGNAYFRRDSLLLVRGEPYLGKSLTPPLPTPFVHDTLRLTYRLEGSRLLLLGDGYSVQLRRH